MDPRRNVTELSDHVLESVRQGQEAALEAVRTFVDTVDQAVPPHREEPSKRQEVIDAGFQMAERLVSTQYEFLHNVVGAAGKALGARSGEAQGQRAGQEPGGPAGKDTTTA